MRIICADPAPLSTVISGGEFLVPMGFIPRSSSPFPGFVLITTMQNGIVTVDGILVPLPLACFFFQLTLGLGH
jgi:hypothetical protein